MPQEILLRPHEEAYIKDNERSLCTKKILELESWVRHNGRSVEEREAEGKHAKEPELAALPGILFASIYAMFVGITTGICGGSQDSFKAESLQGA